MLISCSMTSFSDWLNAQLAERNMSAAELARAMNKDQGVVSRMLRGERSPSPATIQSIANALRLPLDIVLRASLNMTPNPKVDPDDERANHLIQSLKKPSSKQRALDYLQLLIEQEEREERENAAKKNNHPATQPR